MWKGFKVKCLFLPFFSELQATNSKFTKYNYVSTNSDQTAPWEQKKKEREKKTLERKQEVTAERRQGREVRKAAERNMSPHVTAPCGESGAFIRRLLRGRQWHTELLEARVMLEWNTAAASAEPFSHAVAFTHRQSRQSGRAQSERSVFVCWPSKSGRRRCVCRCFYCFEEEDALKRDVL